MKDSELLATLSQRLQLSEVEIGKRVNETTEIIIAELIKNNIISIMNIGALEIKKKLEHISIHPDTGKKILIPPKLTIDYSASPSLIDELKALTP
jgi:nucleoid DNA-binding protein